MIRIKQNGYNRDASLKLKRKYRGLIQVVDADDHPRRQRNVYN